MAKYSAKGRICFFYQFSSFLSLSLSLERRAQEANLLVPSRGTLEGQLIHLIAELDRLPPSHSPNASASADVLHSLLDQLTE